MMCCIYPLQNENVNRPYTSERHVMDLRRSDRRTAMKVLVSKNFKFVDLIWSQYIDLIKTDTRFNDTSNMGLWCHYNIHVYI